jgi:hypothetical protein
MPTATRDGDGISLSGPAITDGQWHQVMVVHDGTTGATRLYLDGSEVAQTTHTYSADFGSATAALTLGWLDLWPYYHYQGDLDEVAIFDAALSAAAVNQHYQRGLLGQGYPTGSGTPTATATATATHTATATATHTPPPPSQPRRRRRPLRRCRRRRRRRPLRRCRPPPQPPRRRRPQRPSSRRPGRSPTPTTACCD